MENLSGNRTGGAKDPLHRFEVRGYAPFVRLSRGGIISFNSSGKIELPASGGLLGTPSAPSTIDAGIFRVTALETCQFRVVYDSAVYLLKYSRLRDVLRNRYDLGIGLRPDWRENLWPYLFDFYVEHGHWPIWKSYPRLFRQMLSKARIDKIASVRGGSRLQRLRARVMMTMMARLGAGWSARNLGDAYAERVANAFSNSEYYEEFTAEVEMFRTITDPDSVVPLAGDYREDEIWFKTPFQLANAQKVSVTGAMRVEHKRELGELFEREFLCSFLELYTASSIILPNRSTITAPQARVPLDAGEKRVYGMTVDAPMTCKAENIHMEILDFEKRGLIHRREESTSGADPTNLFITMVGTEA